MVKRDTVALIVDVDKLYDIRKFLGYGDWMPIIPHMTVAVRYHRN